MSHDHHHHHAPHAHAHGARRAEASSGSLLRASAAVRLGVAFAAAALIWAGVFWAVS